MDEDDFDEDVFDIDDPPPLPPEAGEMTDKGFEPNDVWFKTASRRLQHEVMRQWFVTRFQDPAMDTPYDGGEGGYLYIQGGPYTAEDELYGRFADLVVDPDDFIRRVVDDVEQDGIDAWAPIHYDREDEYDDRFALSILAESEPLQRLRARIEQSKQVLTLQGNEEARRLAQQLVFASAIGATETFLYEVAYFWIDSDEKVLRSVVTRLPALKEEKICLGDLFNRLEGLKVHVKGRLQAMVWHRWDQVAQLYRAALDVRLPSVKELDVALLKRHDVVHRSGHDKDGNPVTVTAAEIEGLFAAIESFATELERRITSRNSEVCDGGIDAAAADAPPPGTSTAL